MVYSHPKEKQVEALMLEQVQKTVRILPFALLFSACTWMHGQQPAPAKPAAPATLPAKAQAPPAAKQPAPAVTPAPAPATAQPAAQESLKTPPAELLWSVEPAKDALPVLPTESGFASLRSAVIVADRVDLVFEVSSEISRGGRPVNTYRLLSLDRTTGEVKGQKEIQGQTLPSILAADDDHLLLVNPSVTRLNPDLTESGEKFEEKSHGQSAFISPDGSVLAHWSGKNTELLDAHTLRFTGVQIKGPEPISVSKRAILTTDSFWSNQFPKDLSFITLIDQRSPHLLYRGPCGGRPAFLSETKILSTGCGKAAVLDIYGKILKDIPLAAAFGWFAGVSRDGSRFAISSSDYPITDPSYAATEVFTIYDAETYAPVATVAPQTLPDARSWSAFSMDGHAFLSGSAKKLNLYKIP